MLNKHETRVLQVLHLEINFSIYEYIYKYIVFLEKYDFKILIHMFHKAKRFKITSYLKALQVGSIEGVQV